MSVIQISSIPMTEMLLESLEVHILSLQIQRTMEHDVIRRDDISSRIDEHETLANDFRSALDKMKNEK